MRLYHGTTTPIAKILNEGIRPRGSKKGNFDHTVKSNPKAVYLTDTYAPYFINTSGGRTPSKGYVIEVETDRLNPFGLFPDEDVLEQAGRKTDNIPGNMKERTLWYRKRVQDYVGVNDHGNPYWKCSLALMGTCCYYGTISHSKMTRVVEIDLTKEDNRARLFFGFDAQISLINFKICGPSYARQTKRLFGDEVEQLSLDDWDFRRDIGMSDVKVFTVTDEGNLVCEKVHTLISGMDAAKELA